MTEKCTVYRRFDLSAEVFWTDSSHHVGLERPTALIEMTGATNEPSLGQVSY